ncbi:MAG: hypothetical protein EHM47_16440 [Ignavibacteriales bacterium]|nr:MAG: hypothetical protein EHM47_16440 [Ignavibacteriales bacterium]
MSKKKGKKKQEDILCLKCLGKIDTAKEKYVRVSTINLKNSPDSHSYFHFSCYIDYFNEKVLNKANEIIQTMQQKAIQMAAPMIAMIKGIMPSLDEEQPITIVSKIKTKIEDDRRKNSKRKKV